MPDVRVHDPYHRPMRRWIRWIVFLVLGVFAGLAITVYLPWYAVAPGPARTVQPLIRFDDRQRYESQGNFVMTSVRFTQLTGVGVLLAWLDPNRAVISRSVLYPHGEDVRQEHERAISQMDSSKLDASAVVMTELEGYPKQHGDGVLVESVQPGCAACTTRWKTWSVGASTRTSVAQTATVTAASRSRSCTSGGPMLATRQCKSRLCIGARLNDSAWCIRIRVCSPRGVALPSAVHPRSVSWAAARMASSGRTRMSTSPIGRMPKV